MEEAPRNREGDEDNELVTAEIELEAASPASSTENDDSVLTEESPEESSDSELESDTDDENDSEIEDLDFANTILKEIKEESYICLICTCEVGPSDKVWSCSDCYRVYHISCVNSWSQKGSSTDENGNWKCPACNSTHRKQKFQNRCWCKKVIHPQTNVTTPNSCGQTCGAKLEGCPHRCTLPCHPGPHAACNALGPPMKCHCGNHESQWPCVLTPYAEGWHCEDVCEEFLPCEVHKCRKRCHDELCGKCEEFVESKCYCGETTDFVKCHLRKPLRSFQTGQNSWIGNFTCSKVSALKYDCGIHSDEVHCHPKSKNLKHCPLSPDVIKTCPCGQSLIEDVNNGQRRSACSDRIPTCGKLCNKKLACGHLCKWNCHEGDCSPCFEFVKTDCRCSYSSFIVPCKFLQGNNVATCARKCSSLLSCRRHRCSQVCCPDERDAETRERTRKKAIRNNTMNARNTQNNESFIIEATHVCLRVCNKKLTCGNPEHLCQRVCHVGPCSPCLESSNQDLVCHCGQTVLMAPIRCGRTLPPCDSQCIRELACGHQQMPHNCHPDDVACPKCTKGVEKWCNCGKKKVRAMCFQEEAFCSERCGNKLPCQHSCLMSCHKGPCVCKSICGKKKKYCDHVDRKACHFPSRCDDTGTCKELVKITCKCGRIKKEVKCGADVEHKSASETLLGCEVACVLQERNDQLKQAFGVAEKSEEEKLELSDLSFSVDLLRIASIQTKWCLDADDMFKEFMTSDKKTFDFKPLKRPQREILHLLAEAYGLYSESHDPEPYRSVFVSRNSKSSVPKHSLSLAIKVFQRISKEQASKPLSAPTAETAQVATNKSMKFNSILIKDCIVGVTKSDLEGTIASVLSEYRHIKLNQDLKWIDGDRYLLVHEAFMRFSEIAENNLKVVIPVLKARLNMNFLANTVELVRIDENYNVVERYDEVKKLEVEEAKQETLVEGVKSFRLDQGENNYEKDDSTITEQ